MLAINPIIFYRDEIIINSIPFTGSVKRRFKLVWPHFKLHSQAQSAQSIEN